METIELSHVHFENSVLEITFLGPRKVIIRHTVTEEEKTFSKDYEFLVKFAMVKASRTIEYLEVYLAKKKYDRCLPKDLFPTLLIGIRDVFERIANGESSATWRK